MLHIRDISLRRRLLLANFTMVFVPVFIITVLGYFLFSGLHFSRQQNDLTTLWPERGPALSIQYTISSLRVKAEHPGPLKLKGMREDCRILESQGMQTAILRDGQPVYVTPGTQLPDLARAVLHKSQQQPTAMIWDGDGLFFRYSSPRTGTTVIAAGPLPFMAKNGIREGLAKNIFQAALVLIVLIASAIIIACGLILSHLVSQQILQPLAALRKAAAAIEKGNLDTPLTYTSRDELGLTVRAFEHMRRRLKEAREWQQKYEQNRKELIAGISHDLATPLTLLKGCASGLLAGIAKTAEKRQHYVTLIYNNACTMEKLVDNLFLFSKLDLGQVAFTPERLSLRDYFSDYVRENKKRLAAEGLLLHYQAPLAACIVKVDRLQFQRVVDNILGNTLKYKETPQVSLDIYLQAKKDSFRLTFADHGPGVPAADLPYLFDIFYRTDSARTDVQKGSGLGLAIVQQIVTASGGRIQAQATPGGGLSLNIDLPAAKEEHHETHTHH